MKPIRITGRPQPRLLRLLADHLEKNVPPDQFDMNHFCGTSRCAFGHAPSVPAIRARGLTYVGMGDDTSMRLRKTDERRMKQMGMHGDFGRAAFLFGISFKESENLFVDKAPGGRPESIKAVARRLRRFADKLAART